MPTEPKSVSESSVSVNTIYQTRTYQDQDKTKPSREIKSSPKQKIDSLQHYCCNSNNIGEVGCSLAYIHFIHRKTGCTVKASFFQLGELPHFLTNLA